ncbi:MAG: hypothetical protein KAG64_05365 [Bacteroidales bacterium]|nr:hypothetical protein [Bacteroidales bacterium]
MHWQYLVLAISLSFFGSFFWSFNAISSQTEYGVIAVLIAIVQGFMAFFYMHEKGDPRLIFYSLLFSLSTYFLGKYLLFVHYYDWVIAGVVDKDTLSYSLLFFYFKVIDMASLEDFFYFFKSSFDLFEAFILLLIIVPTWQYLFFWRNENDMEEEDSSNSKRRIRRRFTGQQF